MSFEEWWFSTQFDKAYWEANGCKHQTEYTWAEVAFIAGVQAERERCARLAEEELTSASVFATSREATAATQVKTDIAAAIREG